MPPHNDFSLIPTSPSSTSNPGDGPPPPSYGDIPQLSIGAFIKQKIDDIVRGGRDKVALIENDTNHRLTFQKWSDQAIHLASKLVEGTHPLVTPTDCIVLYSDNNIDYALAMLSLAYLGVTMSQAKPANGAFELHSHIVALQPVGMLIVSHRKLGTLLKMLEHEEYRSSVNALKSILVIGQYGQLDQEALDQIELIRNHSYGPQQSVVVQQQLLAIRPESSSMSMLSFPIPYFAVDPQTTPFIILLTSGTTGLPKGAVHSNYTFLAGILNTCRVDFMQNCFAKTAALLLPFGHVSGSTYVWVSIMQELTSVLYEHTNRYEQIIGSIPAHRTQTLTMTQDLAIEMYDKSVEYVQRYDLSSLQCFMYGGSKFSKKIVESLERSYAMTGYEFYGATEFMGCVTKSKSMPFECVGTALGNVQVKVVDPGDEDRKPLDFDQTGELCFRGPCCFVGYLNNPRATRSTIDADGWYHTGDIGHLDREGRIYLTDRLKEMVKYKLWSVAPAEIENFLHTHPAVLDVCVVGVKHKTELYHLRAYIQLRSKELQPDGSREQVAQELMEYVKDNMGYQKRLNGGVHFVHTIPRTVVGKVDRSYFKSLTSNELLTCRAPLE